MPVNKQTDLYSIVTVASFKPLEAFKMYPKKVLVDYAEKSLKYNKVDIEIVIPEEGKEIPRMVKVKAEIFKTHLGYWIGNEPSELCIIINDGFKLGRKESLAYERRLT